MEQAIHIAVWALGLFGGAHLLENKLENYVMDRVPQWAKGLVVPVISAAFAALAASQGGIDPWQAFLGALGFAGYVDKVHNDPKTTSADWPIPPALPGEEPVDPSTLPK